MLRRYLLALSSGPRLGELLALKREELKFGRGDPTAVRRSLSRSCRQAIVVSEPKALKGAASFAFPLPLTRSLGHIVNGCGNSESRRPARARKTGMSLPPVSEPRSIVDTWRTTLPA